MYPGIRLVNELVLFYGARLPYHPGKWRVIEALVGAFRLRDFYAGKSFNVRRRRLSWELHPDCLVQRWLYYLSWYEHRETNWIRGRVRPGWVFFDVGANFGYYSLLVSDFSGRTAEVYAFEPFAPNHRLLNRNKALNGLERLRTFKLALSDRDGEVEFLLPKEDNLGHGRILADEKLATPERSVERVATTTLDVFVARHAVEKIDFIKVDIEGAEMLFLAGAAETLRRLRPALMIECNPEGLAEFGTTADRMLKAINELGYEAYRLERSGLQPMNDARTIEDYCNLMCLPRSG